MAQKEKKNKVTSFYLFSPYNDKNCPHFRRSQSHMVLKPQARWMRTDWKKFSAKKLQMYGTSHWNYKGCHCTLSPCIVSQTFPCAFVIPSVAKK